MALRTLYELSGKWLWWGIRKSAFDADIAQQQQNFDAWTRGEAAGKSMSAPAARAGAVSTVGLISDERLGVHEAFKSVVNIDHDLTSHGGFFDKPTASSGCPS